MKKLLAIDGNSILNRAFYGIRLLSTKEGLYTNAIYGFLNIILRQKEAIQPDYCAVAFDLKAKTFRHKMYDGYKANRKGMPEELAVQLPYAKKCAEIFGFNVLEKEGYEADDILGTLAEMACNSDEPCEAYILTGDKDSLQLINGSTRILLAGNSETTLYDTEKFVEKYGVCPECFVDVKALMGDTSDNIPGVAGIGEKTALKLIKDFGSLEALYGSYEQAEMTASLKNKLSQGKESAFMSQNLARIYRSVPIEKSLFELAERITDVGKAKELLTKLEFTSFIKRLPTSAANAQEKSESSDHNGKIEEIKRISVDSAIVNAIDKGKQVAFVMTEDGFEIYDGNTLLEYNGHIKDIADFFNGRKNILTCDSKEIYKELHENRIAFEEDFALDIHLGAYVISSSSDSTNLAVLVTRYLEEEYREDYPIAVYVYRLALPIKERIVKDGLEELVYSVEMPLARVLAKMEITGTKIDRSGLEAYGRYLSDLESEIAERIYTYAGESFNINSPKQLGEILFEKMQLPCKKKTKTGYSTGAEILEGLVQYHPIAEEILEYRQIAKLRGTYAEGLLKVADKNSVIHTSFKQTVTATGRLSSAEPNLQNIPIRTELGREFRRYFVPHAQGRVIIDADYSQIELRVMAHIADDEVMKAAFLNEEDIHTSTAAAVFETAPESVTPEQRKRAKAVNFGIIYGMGEFSLAKDLEISVSNAKKYISNYLAGFPKVDKYLKDIVEKAYADGYVTTLHGRRRYISELAEQNKNIKKFGERVAMNSPIQGTAADIMKIAMINVDRRIEKSGIDAALMLQVHDELIIDAAEECAEEAINILKEEMESAVSLSVPLKVSCGMGATWYDAEH